MGIPLVGQDCTRTRPTDALFENCRHSRFPVIAHSPGDAFLSGPTMTSSSINTLSTRPLPRSPELNLMRARCPRPPESYPTKTKQPVRSPRTMPLKHDTFLKTYRLKYAMCPVRCQRSNPAPCPHPTCRPRRPYTAWSSGTLHCWTRSRKGHAYMESIQERPQAFKTQLETAATTGVVEGKAMPTSFQITNANMLLLRVPHKPPAPWYTTLR